MVPAVIAYTIFDAKMRPDPRFTSAPDVVMPPSALTASLNVAGPTTKTLLLNRAELEKTDEPPTESVFESVSGTPTMSAPVLKSGRDTTVFAITSGDDVRFVCGADADCSGGVCCVRDVFAAAS